MESVAWRSGKLTSSLQARAGAGQALSAGTVGEGRGGACGRPLAAHSRPELRPGPRGAVPPKGGWASGRHRRQRAGRHSQPSDAVAVVARHAIPAAGARAGEAAEPGMRPHVNHVWRVGPCVAPPQQRIRCNGGGGSGGRRRWGEDGLHPTSGCLVHMPAELGCCSRPKTALLATADQRGTPEPLSCDPGTCVHMPGPPASAQSPAHRLSVRPPPEPPGGPARGPGGLPAS